jgi:hypothetical protein
MPSSYGPGPDPAECPPAIDAIRGEVRLAGHRRVSHGLFLRLVPGLNARTEFLRELKAWQLVLPDGAAFTHVTGAQVLGWEVPQLPEQVPVFAAVQGTGAHPRRPGLICSRLVRPSQAALIFGVPVDTPEEILLRAARDFGLLDLTIMVDSARRAGQVNSQRMAEILASGRPGVRMLQKAWSMSDVRAGSVGETILRIFHALLDVPVEPQAVLLDDRGNVVGHADLLIVGTVHVQEYDGEVHRDKKQHRIDLRRERGLSATAFERRGYTLDDLLNHPVTLMHELDRMLGRPHRMARVRRWQRLAENSLYAERGRERVLNRWRRVNGIIDWTETA